MSRRIVVHCTTNLAGTDCWEFLEVPVEMLESEIDSLAHEYAIDNAESYGMSYSADYGNDLSDEDEDSDGFICDDDIGSSWFDYNPERHDCFYVGSRDEHGNPKFLKL